MFLVIEGEGRAKTAVRFSWYWIRIELPRSLRQMLGRVKLIGFDLPTQFHFRIQTKEEYHREHCDTIGYCPDKKTYYESPVNYCPYCGLNFLKIRARRSGLL